MFRGSQQDSVSKYDHVMVTSVLHSIFQQSISPLAYGDAEAMRPEDPKTSRLLHAVPVPGTAVT